MTAAPVFDLDFVARALLGNRPATNSPIEQVTVDSRACGPSSLFVALRGAKADGADFAAQAVRQGAIAVLASRPLPDLGVPVFVQRDPQQALRALARAWRRHHSIPLVAVAGSVGKTTTKELIASLLRAHLGAEALLATAGNQNGWLGVPLTLLRLRSHHRAAVVEIGIDECGAMRSHLDLADPSHAIVTAIGPEHLDLLGTLEVVAQEEGLALRYVASRGGLAFFPAADPWLSALAPGLGSAARPWALISTAGAPLPQDPPSSAPPLTSAQYSAIEGTLAIDSWSTPPFRCPLPGAHNASNILGALSVAASLGAPPEALHRGLSTFTPAPGRSELICLPFGATLLCDWYNASPSSVEAALNTLATLPASRRFAVLGDMLELGADEEALHRQLVPHIRGAQLTGLWLVGPRMAWLAHELGTSPLDPGNPPTVAHVASASEAGPPVAAALAAGDAILVKGSRGMALEQIMPWLARSI